MTTLLPNAADRATATRLPLAAGQALHRLADVLQRGDAQLAHVPLGLVAHVLAVEHPEHRAEDAGLALLAAEEQVVGDVQARGDGEGLVDGLDAGARGRPSGCGSGPRSPVQLDLALVRDRAPRTAP